MADQLDQSELSPAAYRPSTLNWRPPRSLKLVAFLFILSGVLGVTESVLKAVVFGRFDPGSFVFGILFALTGRGLLQWRDGWRQFALFLSWLYLAMGCLMVLSAWNLLFRGDSNTQAQFGFWQVGAWLVPAVGLAVVGFAYSAVRVLRRKDIAWRCANRHLADDQELDDILSLSPRRWRFSLATMFLATIIIAFVLARVTATDVVYEPRHRTQTWATVSGQTRGIEYGVRSNRFFREQDELVYAVFSTGERWESHVHRHRANRVDYAFIKTLYEGARKIDPATHQLYEIVDGKVRTRDERVSLDEFEDFINSGPADWSLDALVKHAEAMRAQQPQKRAR